MDQNLNQSNLRYIRLSGKWTKTWFKANREVHWGRTFGKFCNDCGERGKHRNTLRYCYGSSILIKRGGGREKGGTGTFLFLHTWRRGRLQPLPPRATSWPRCSCPPFRAPDACLRGDCRARTARPACATHPAHLLPCLFGDGNGATRGSLEAVHAGRVIPDQLVRRAKTGTSGGAGTASSSL